MPDIRLDTAGIEAARTLLNDIPPADTRASVWMALMAAGMAASAAVLLAGLMILGPGMSLDAPPPSETPQGRLF